MITRPILAFKIRELELAAPLLPLLATPKIDGFRCYKEGGRALSRSGKPIANEFTRSMIEANCPDGFDGELIVNGGTFNDCQSAFTTKAGMPDFSYMVFDYIPNALYEPYDGRCARLRYVNVAPFVQKVLPTRIDTLEKLEQYEQQKLKEGYEGVMLRKPESPYKCNRSTYKEGYLVALKRFADAEAIIIGFIEQMHNANEAFDNELGFTKRSTHQENQIPMDTLGALIARDIKTGVEFSIGTGIGLTRELRQAIWEHQSSYLGKVITYTYLPHGMKDKPRHPSFKGFRAVEDL